MPLSSSQLATLKNGATQVQLKEENPHRPGTKAHERYERYKVASTILEAGQFGATFQDLSGNFEKGYLTVLDQSADRASTSKRGAVEGTPDREGNARSKVPARDLAPKFSDTLMTEKIERVEMSPATIAALRGMIKEEIRAGNEEVQRVVAAKMEEAIAPLKEELEKEREYRKKLEHRIGILEDVIKAKGGGGGGGSEQVDSDVDKSVVVVGGFGEMEADATEKFVEDAFKDVNGVEEVFVTNPEPVVAFVRFDSDTAAMKFLRRQRRYQKFKDAHLWASENRSIEERRRVKILSKIKKFAIEYDNYEAKDIIVNYRTFKVHTRVGRKLVHLADVMDDASVLWAEGEHAAGDILKGAVEEVVEELSL